MAVAMQRRRRSITGSLSAAVDNRVAMKFIKKKFAGFNGIPNGCFMTGGKATL